MDAQIQHANPFPRFGHTANVAAGKEGEIYIFEGLVKDKRMNNLYVINLGIYLYVVWLVACSLGKSTMTSVVVSTNHALYNRQINPYVGALVGYEFVHWSTNAVKDRSSEDISLLQTV